MRVLRVCALILGLGLIGRFGYQLLNPENLTRHPPQLDPLRAAILKQTHLEANLEAKQLGDQVDLSARLNVVFPHVPARADKVEIERTVRALVKQHLPRVREVDVQFGDNLKLVGPPPPERGLFPGGP